MEIRVNATRMELLKLGRKSKLAVRGHKLLKDKLDGLVQDFIKRSKELRSLYNEVREEFIELISRSIISETETEELALVSALQYVTHKVNVKIDQKNLMGCKISELSIESEGEIKSFGDFYFSEEFTSSLEGLKEILPKLLKLAELYKTIQRVGREIIEIKRRVNALEYVLIPELEAKVKYIKMKLAEMERGNIVSLMKIKDMVRAE